MAGNLLDFVYLKKNYRLIAIDLSKQTKLKDPQQISFIEKLDEANGATMFFIIEKSEETTSFCDYCDTYDPFKDCRTEINETFIDEAEYINITMPMCNLIGYSDNYSDTSGSLWQFKRDDLKLLIICHHLNTNEILLAILA